MGLTNTFKEVANRWSTRAEPAGDDAPAQSVLRRRTGHSGSHLRAELTGLMGDGRYSLEAPIGTGATGIIYSAWHTHLQRRVALKVLRPQYAKDAAMDERLLHEARMASMVENEHVVEILDCGRLENGRAYFVMEQLDGQRLSDLLDEHRTLDLGAAVDIAVQLAEGLCGTHQAGVVHGDIKPDNILLCQRPTTAHYVKIIDYGVALPIEERPPTSRSSLVCGTPSYMSPEQAVGAPLDGRSDLYSFGVVLYEMLSGNTPIQGRYPGELLGKQRSSPPVPLRSRERCGHIPPRIEAIVHRCLEKDPARRYPSATDLLRELQFVQRRLQEGVSTGPLSARPCAGYGPPRAVALPKVVPLMAAAPANDLGRPITSIPLSQIPSLVAETQEQGIHSPPLPAPPPSREIRARAAASITRHARRTRNPSWSHLIIVTTCVGVSLGYVGASLYGYMAVKASVQQISSD